MAKETKAKPLPFLPKVDGTYVVPLEKFDFKDAFTKALSDTGYWFKAQSGDVFALFMARDHPNDGHLKERISSSLYMQQPDGSGRLVAVLDVAFTENGEGMKATCFSPLTGTAKNNCISYADEARKTKAKYGYYIDDKISASAGKGAYEGIGRFLLTMQGMHAQGSNIKKFSIYTPTTKEYEILRKFYFDSGAKELTIPAPERENEKAKLEVDLSHVEFKTPSISKRPFTPARLPPILGEDNAEPVFFSRFRGNLKNYVERAKSKEGCTIRMSNGDTFVLFIREHTLDLGLPENANLKNANKSVTQLAVSLFYHDKNEKALKPASFCDRTIFTTKEGLTYSENYGPPILNSDPHNEHILEMDKGLRATLPNDPHLNLPLGHGTAHEYSRHHGGMFSGAGRFSLSIAEEESKLHGAKVSKIYITKAKGIGEWARKVYGDAIPGDWEGDFLTIDNLQTREIKLDEITQSVQTKIDQYASSKTPKPK